MRSFIAFGLMVSTFFLGSIAAAPLAADSDTADAVKYGHYGGGRYGGGRYGGGRYGGGRYRYKREDVDSNEGNSLYYDPYWRGGDPWSGSYNGGDYEGYGHHRQY